MAVHVNDLELPYLDLFNAQTREERRQLVEEVRQADHWLVRTPGGYLITTYDDSVALLRDRRFYQFAAKLAEMAGEENAAFFERSEERRVGKECRSRVATEQ